MRNGNSSISLKQDSTHMNSICGTIKNEARSAINTLSPLTKSPVSEVIMAKQSLPFSNSTKQLCSIDGCSRIERARTYCATHWSRWRKYGDPIYCKHPRIEGDVSRFWKNVALTANPDKCWLWLGSKESNGYGLFGYNRQRSSAHRYSLFLKTGRWPELFVLHSCDVRHCVNPSHLREGTATDNMRDRLSRGWLLSQRG